MLGTGRCGRAVRETSLAGAQDFWGVRALFLEAKEWVVLSVTKQVLSARREEMEKQKEEASQSDLLGTEEGDPERAGCRRLEAAGGGGGQGVSGANTG